MFSSYGGKLAPLDRLARAVLGLALIIWSFLAGWSLWPIVVAVAIGASLLVEAALNYCPLARTWPWNRTAR